MARPLDKRLDRVEGRRTAAAEQDAAAISQRRIWRVEAAMGAVILNALAGAGCDPAQATRLCLADQAAEALIALPDTPKLQHADINGLAAPEAQNQEQGDAFADKILSLARGFAGAPPPDFANASFAELFAWSIAQPTKE